MYKKININTNTFFLIEDATENINYNDEVVLSVVIHEKKYCIRQDSYIYWVGHFLKLFSDSSNYNETKSDDLGHDYFMYENNLNQDIDSRDLHEFDSWVVFGGETAVLFYKKFDKLYCQITQNDWKKGEYKNLCLAEITLKTLEEWKQLLS